VTAAVTEQGPGPVAFELPDGLIATEPVEASGLARHDVRLLVASRSDGGLVDTSFLHLPDFLAPGDLLVVNTSATVAAAVPSPAGLVVHLATELPGGLWLVEPRTPCRAGTLPFSGVGPGQRIPLPAGGSVELLAPFPARARTGACFL
jgi:S-adenosylmethionine:tRNA ribosyltransferase-isomerase